MFEEGVEEEGEGDWTWRSGTDEEGEEVDKGSIRSLWEIERDSLP